ncbi:MAG: hypothetical protein Q9167_001289 [Letrouitia subvulpina]
MSPLTLLDSHLRPKIGYFEQVEMDFEPRCDDQTLPPDARIRQWYNSLAQATYLANRPIAYRHDTREMLAAQGFVDIEDEVIRVPLSEWSASGYEKDMSRWYSLTMTEGLEAYSLAAPIPVAYQTDQDQTHHHSAKAMMPLSNAELSTREGEREAKPPSARHVR